MPRSALLLLLPLAFLLAACAETSSQPADAEPGHEATEHDEEELAPYMASLQRYAEKLYLAGASENWELAGFYEHELHEVAEELAEGGFEEDGHDVSALTERMLLPALASVAEATGTGDAERFGPAYEALLTACNGCHAATEHGFIRLQAPTASAFPSQVFTP